MTDRKREKEIQLLLCEIDSLEGCIEQWFEILEMLSQSKQSTTDFFDKFREYGVFLPDQEAGARQANQKAIEKVQHIIEKYQDKRDGIIDRLAWMA